MTLVHLKMSHIHTQLYICIYIYASIIMIVQTKIVLTYLEIYIHICMRVCLYINTYHNNFKKKREITHLREQGVAGCMECIRERDGKVEWYNLLIT